MMIAVIVAIASVLVVAALVGLRLSRSGSEAILEHQRALAALREAEHPRAPGPAETRPALVLTDHVHILDEPPAGRSGARRRARAVPGARRPVARPAKGRRRTAADFAERPTIASLPSIASLSADHAAGPSEPLPRPAADARPAPEVPFPSFAPEVPVPELPVPEVPVPDLHVPEMSEPAGSGAFARVPLEPAWPADLVAPVAWEPLALRTRRRRVSAARVATVAAVVAVGVVIAGVVGAAHDGSNAAAGQRPPSRPTTTRPRTSTTPAPHPTTTTVPTPVVETASGNGTVTVVVPFTLVLAPTGTCWVSVRTATGQTLYEGTLHAGQRQPVVGTGPLVIRLGNTAAMTMQLNGAPLDLSGVGHTADLSFVSA